MLNWYWLVDDVTAFLKSPEEAQCALTGRKFATVKGLSSILIENFIFVFTD